MLGQTEFFFRTAETLYVYLRLLVINVGLVDIFREEKNEKKTTLCKTR